jgi:hypothetical protein
MTGTVLSTLPSLPEATWRSNGMFVADNVSQHPVIPSDNKLSSPDLGSSDPDVHARHMLSPPPSNSQENGVHQRSVSRSLFKWKSDSEYQNSKVSSGISIRLLFSLFFSFKGGDLRHEVKTVSLNVCVGFCSCLLACS